MMHQWGKYIFQILMTYMAENPETGEQGYKKVVRTFIHEKYLLVHVYAEDEEIITTEEHPFYVEGTGFVTAGELQCGDILRLADGRKIPVKQKGFEYLEEPVLVYNFEVEDFHIYYVSGLGVLVHNDCSLEGASNSRKILNVGAGDIPIPCATNIDIKPGASGVIFGDVNDLSQFASGEFDHIIALNPYEYKLLDSDAPRVLKNGGIMSVTGNYSNTYFKEIYNASPEALRQAGFEIISKGGAASVFIKYGNKVTGGVRHTKGIPLQIILRKVGEQ